MPWAKLHTDILGDPKLMRAARKGAKALVYLPWLIAFAKQADDGGCLTVGGEPAEPADIAALVPSGTSSAVASALVSLEEIGVLTRDPRGALCFAKWELRAASKWDKKPETASTGNDVEPTGGMVYFARCNDQVKIGFSRNPWARVAELRTARPDVRLVAVEPGDRFLERKRQQELGGRTDFRNNGRGAEWFPWTPAIADFVGTLQGATDATTETRSELATDSRSTREENREEEKREEKTRGEPRATRPAPAWVDNVAGRWLRRVGKVKSTTVQRELAAAVSEHGEPAVLAAIDAYADARLAAEKPCKLEWFASEASVWVERSTEHLVVDPKSGLPNERGMAILTGAPR